MDRHNGVGVSGEEIKPWGAKALRMCSISIASCPLYVEKSSFARSFGVSRTTILYYSLILEATHLVEGVSSESHLSGKLFVQFIALMYLSYIDKVMYDQDLYKSYTLTELLDELDVIECYSYPGHTEKIGEMTKKQKELYEAFGVPLPA